MSHPGPSVVQIVLTDDERAGLGWCAGRRGLGAGGLTGLEDAAPVSRPRTELVLTEAERAQLTRWAKRAKTAWHLALRAKVVLRCPEGGTNRQTADEILNSLTDYPTKLRTGHAANQQE